MAVIEKFFFLNLFFRCIIIDDDFYGSQKFILKVVKWNRLAVP